MNPLLRSSSLSPFSCPAPRGQRGAVLIIALVMLLLLTLIGVAGLRDTQLQERMAGGAQDREIALQAAEAALREAEEAVEDGDVSDLDGGDAVKYYDGPDDPDDLQRKDGGGNAVTEVAYWRDHYDWGGNNSTPYATTLVGVTDFPLYVIEQLPSTYSAIAGSTNAGVASASGIPTITDYLITVRATGATADTVVILQSMYRYVETPP